MNINGINWMFNLYFSSDWKFLTICLGFNLPIAYFFVHGAQSQKKKWQTFIKNGKFQSK